MKSPKKILASACALLGMVLNATSVLAADPPALANASDAAERARVSQLIDQAKKEGTINWTAMFISSTCASAVQEGFKKFYGLPDEKFEFTYSSFGDLVTRINQTLAANKNTADVILVNGYPFMLDLQKRGELMKYNSPYYKDYTLSDAAGLSMPGYWVSDGYTFTPAYNPAVLAEDGLKDWKPTKWTDFADPRLKGLLAMFDLSTSSGAINVVNAISKRTGPNWLSDVLKNTDPRLYTQSATARDWLASGEMPIALFEHASDIGLLLKNNVNIKLIYPTDGVLIMPLTEAIMAKAPDPAGAKLMIDYMRSAHGPEDLVSAGCYMFFGRPGVAGPKNLLPGWENVNVIKYDWVKDAADVNLKPIREQFISIMATLPKQ